MPGQPSSLTGDPHWGLCATCVHAVAVRSDKGSTFVQCARAKDDSRYRRYPLVPVIRCDGHATTA